MRMTVLGVSVGSKLFAYATGGRSSSEMVYMLGPMTILPFKLKGYQKPLTKKCRINTAGGLAIYVRTGINFVENKINHQGKAEILSCQILGRENGIHIYNYYLSKGSMNQFQDWEQSFDKNNKTVLITGDFNLNHLLWNPEGDFRSDTEALNLIEFMEEFLV